MREREEETLNRMKKMTQTEANIIGNFVAERVGALEADQGYVLIALKATTAQAQALADGMRAYVEESGKDFGSWFMGFVEAPRESPRRPTSYHRRRPR